MNINTALRAGTVALKITSDAPDVDAERLLLHVTGKHEPSWLYAHGDEPLNPEQVQRLTSLITERKAGKPLVYILGEAEFYGRPFYVNENVLVPRSETEQLVNIALEFISRVPSPAADDQCTIADIGTGSGCIAVTLALELPNTHIIATDISPAALAVARRNAKRHGVLDQIEFLEGNMLEPFDFARSKPYIDLIVSNPPYVPSAEVAHAAAAFDTHGLTFEPQIALDGGPDGQQFVNQIKTAGVPYVMEVTGGKIEATISDTREVAVTPLR